MSETIPTISFDVSAEEMKKLFDGKSFYNHDMATKTGQFIERVLRASETCRAAGDDTYEDLGTVLIETARFFEEYINEKNVAQDAAKQKPERVLGVLKARRDAFVEKGNSFKWLAEHVIAGATYRLTEEEVRLAGLVTWPDRLYSGSIIQGDGPSARLLEKRYSPSDEIHGER